jgi:outer membrane murein-binding lipoprotein Lpp
MVYMIIGLLLSGCETLGGSSRGDSPQLTIKRQQAQISNLQSQIQSMERNSGQLEQHNSQLRAERDALKNQLNAAVQSLDSFRYRSLSMLGELVNNPDMLRAVGNEAVPRNKQVTDVRMDEPQLMVDYGHQLEQNFVVRAFGGYFDSPTRVQLWLLSHDVKSDMYTVLYRSKTYNAQMGEQTFFLDEKKTINGRNVVYGFYFPQGNISVPFHSVNPNQHGSYYSNSKRLAEFGVGNLVGLNERKELNGAKFSWRVLGI